MTKIGDKRQVGANDDGESKQVGAMTMAKTNGSMQMRACDNGENKWEVGMWEQATMAETSKSKQARARR